MVVPCPQTEVDVVAKAGTGYLFKLLPRQGSYRLFKSFAFWHGFYENNKLGESEKFVW